MTVVQQKLLSGVVIACIARDFLHRQLFLHKRFVSTDAPDSGKTVDEALSERTNKHRCRVAKF